jgi:two-component system sensor histidine kinase MprB
MSFRARLGTFIALAVGLTVALAALASYFVVRHQLLAQIDRSLQTDVTSAKSVSAGGVIDPNLAARFLEHNGGFLQVITTSGIESSSLRDSFGVPPTHAQEAIAGTGSGNRFDTMRFQGADYRVLTEGATTLTSPPQTVALQIARPMGDIDHTLSTLGVILWFVTLGGIALAVGLGYLIGRQTLKPVAALTEAAEYVAATQDLSSSIEVETEDELGRLARSFNSMLIALAASRAQQVQLISDAGHELRTPLTSLRTNIEVLMRMPDLPAAERREMFTDVEAQLQELTNLVGDLVDLARHEERDTEPIEVRLDSIVQNAVDRARRRAPSISFETHLTAGSVRAQPSLLERAVMNVLDNAAKWSPPGSLVEVWLQRGAIWTLDVHDHGPGISADDLPHVFERFYRADSARSMPGSGLGLAIVRHVIANNGGTVSASVPPEGGTVIHIELPIVAEDEATPDVASAEPAESFLSR